MNQHTTATLKWLSRLFFALLVRLLFGVTIFPVVWHIASVGASTLNDEMSTPLHKVIMFSKLGETKEGRKLMLAHPFILVLMVATIWGAEKLVRFYHAGKRLTNFQRMCWVVATGAICLDLFLLFVGMRAGAFFGGVSLLAALALTLAYLLIVFFVACVVHEIQRGEL